MARCLEPLVPIARIAHRDPLHCLAERLIRDLNQRVQMIRHPTERMDSVAELGQDVGDYCIQCTAIALTPEQWLSMIAAQDDVIATAGNMQAGMRQESKRCSHRSHVLALVIHSFVFWLEPRA